MTGILKSRSRVVVEIAVDSLASAIAADRGGAARIELCASLDIGGLTPSAGLVSTVLEHVDTPVFVMIRPRGGDFVYSGEEFDVMCRDIALNRAFGARGFVLGVLNDDHSIDTTRLRALVAAAGGLPVTFHRAFDMTPDPMAALECLISENVNRVLTSGGARTAMEGADALAALIRSARGRIIVVPGGTIRDDHVQALIGRTGAVEIHTRLTTTGDVDEVRVRRFVDLCFYRGATDDCD